MTNEPTQFGIPSDKGGKDLGIFMPIANGGWIISKNKPEIDGSYDYNRRAAMLAEEAGVDFIMAMAKYRGYGGETEHWNYTLDSVVAMAGLAEATTKVKCWATIHTILQNPGVAAKMIATLDQISGGRAGLNLVTGSYKQEFSQMGAWPEGVGHDARYDLAYEWIRAIKKLWSEDSVTQKGDYFELEDCESWPKPEKKPFTVCAGTSEKGMRFSAEEMDAIFLSGGTPQELAEANNKAKEVADDVGRYLRTYSMMTIVLGETDQEAEAMADNFRDGFDEGALEGMMRAYGMIDKEIGKENAFTKSARSGFMSPRIIGSPESVTEQMEEMLEVGGTDGMMLIFPDYHKMIPVFGTEVLPALRKRFPGKVAASVNG
ncbi:LLM class flavin-dependent oxidoreductase [Altererythrobacter endophyticus]|uniref:LLM class flavin-dependent oxidoreductase n=2 Tax=Altericroceibacterium endophyticum TaxID=1808508 RepID=A0A6I4T3Y9_9SPHN|nr:LLM class flavin-dependent oxidoreductase [Altericroceibacterium endophyticum]MXO65019.1 LLM class flavin-dependent oxidoreductase [Altericroceibacterium endophyticum]